jgi:hypothetical protein
MSQQRMDVGIKSPDLRSYRNRVPKLPKSVGAAAVKELAEDPEIIPAPVEPKVSASIKPITLREMIRGRVRDFIRFFTN